MMGSAMVAISPRVMVFCRGAHGRPSRSVLREPLGGTARLDAVGNGALHALKEEQAAEKDDQDGNGAGSELRARGLAMAGEGPAEAVDDAGHGIEAVEPAVALRNDRAGVGDRRGKNPELHQKGDDVADAAVQGVEG